MVKGNGDDGKGEEGWEGWKIKRESIERVEHW